MQNMNKKSNSYSFTMTKEELKSLIKTCVQEVFDSEKAKGNLSLTTSLFDRPQEYRDTEFETIKEHNDCCSNSTKEF